MAVNHGSHASDVIGNITRYNGGQNSFAKFTTALSEIKKLIYNNII